MSGRVVSIHVAAREGGELSDPARVELVAGKGLAGDRYFSGDDEAAVTLVDAAQVAWVNAALGLEIAPRDTRRNLVTEGIDLNAFVGKRLRVGGALIEGCELCEPCRSLGESLAGQRSPAEIVRAFAARGGLRGRILSTGTVRVGDPVAPA